LKRPQEVIVSKKRRALVINNRNVMAEGHTAQRKPASEGMDLNIGIPPLFSVGLR